MVRAAQRQYSFSEIRKHAKDWDKSVGGIFDERGGMGERIPGCWLVNEWWNGKKKRSLAELIRHVSK